MNKNLTSRQRREVARLEEKNDAEQLLHIQAHMGKPLKHLNPESFHRNRPVLSVTTTRMKESDSGFGFRRGDRVAMNSVGRVNAALSGDQTEGVVTSVLEDGDIRVNGRIYAARIWQLTS